MKRFECNECGNPGPCVSYQSRDAITKAEKYNGLPCPDCNYRNQFSWREIKPKSLPKLTAEALAERGIEWPEWATCAAVDSDASARFFKGDITPFYADDVDPLWIHSGLEYGDVLIPGKWDGSDWQNSKIVRPENPKLPEWCKVGAWVYNDQFGFGKVVIPSNPFGFCVVDWETKTGSRGGVKHDQLLPAHWRKWNAAEMREKVGVVFSFRGYSVVCIGFRFVSVRDLNNANSVPAKEIGLIFEMDQESFTLTAKALASSDRIKFNGSPCGVLEVVEPK